MTRGQIISFGMEQKAGKKAKTVELSMRIVPFVNERPGDEAANWLAKQIASLSFHEINTKCKFLYANAPLSSENCDTIILLNNCTTIPLVANVEGFEVFLSPSQVVVAKNIVITQNNFPKLRVPSVEECFSCVMRR